MAGIILTGGKSVRMGRDKVTMDLAGRPMWQWVAEALRPVVAGVSIVGTVEFQPHDPSISFIADDPPGYGPLCGIATGLETSGCFHNIVVAVDYPLVRCELLELLLRQSSRHQAVCGRSGQFLEPLVAYYHSSCAPIAREMMAGGEFRTHRLYERVKAHILSEEEYQSVDPDRLSQINVNTPFDADRAAAILRAAGRTSR